MTWLLLLLFGVAPSLSVGAGAEFSPTEAFRFVATRHTPQPPIAERRGYLYHFSSARCVESLPVICNLQLTNYLEWMSGSC